MKIQSFLFIFPIVTDYRALKWGFTEFEKLLMSEIFCGPGWLSISPPKLIVTLWSKIRLKISWIENSKFILFNIPFWLYWKTNSRIMLNTKEWNISSIIKNYFIKHIKCNYLNQVLAQIVDRLDPWRLFLDNPVKQSR